MVPLCQSLHWATIQSVGSCCFSAKGDDVDLEAEERLAGFGAVAPAPERPLELVLEPAAITVAPSVDVVVAGVGSDVVEVGRDLALVVDVRQQISDCRDALEGGFELVFGESL